MGWRECRGMRVCRGVELCGGNDWWTQVGVRVGRVWPAWWWMLICFIFF